MWLKLLYQSNLNLACLVLQETSWANFKASQQHGMGAFKRFDDCDQTYFQATILSSVFIAYSAWLLAVLKFKSKADDLIRQNTSLSTPGCLPRMHKPYYHHQQAPLRSTDKRFWLQGMWSSSHAAMDRLCQVLSTIIGCKCYSQITAHQPLLWMTSIVRGNLLLG